MQSAIQPSLSGGEAWVAAYGYDMKPHIRNPTYGKDMEPFLLAQALRLEQLDGGRDVNHAVQWARLAVLECLERVRDTDPVTAQPGMQLPLHSCYVFRYQIGQLA
jgi:hypothetical protein